MEVLSSPVRIESLEKGRPEFFWNLSSSRYSFQYTIYVHKILKNLFFSKIYSKGRKGVGKPRLLTLLHSSEKSDLCLMKGLSQSSSTFAILLEYKSLHRIHGFFYDINMSNFEVPLQGHFIKHKHLFLKSYYTAPVEIPINSFCYRIVNIVKFWNRIRQFLM